MGKWINSEMTNNEMLKDGSWKYIGTCENIMSKEKQTCRQRNTRMCKCKNVANYRQKNDQICVWCVGDIFAKMNDFHKMRM